MHEKRITSKQLEKLIVSYEAWMNQARLAFKLAATQSQRSEIGVDLSQDILSLQRGLHFVYDIVKEQEA